MKTDNNYRIRTNIGENTVLKVPLKRDIDFLEILSLKVSQKGLYKLHASNYGVVIGRVLANDGFGIPNARLSVFVELSDEDAKNGDIVQYYPYTSISTRDKQHRRYNLLPDNKSNDCYRIVGTFPNKRLVLDNNTQIEIYDKYWKYTTTTNAAGDYMIFGIPTGSQTIHLDIDLSNIGILSQKPRDFVYKGYNVTSFDNASQFKESTNLDNLVQIIGQNHTLNVYPFWGDKDAEGIVSITRQDINVAYKFETTCVFMGSIASDNNSNSIGHECTPTKKMGFNNGLVASEGTIEMIRKTQDGLVEEVQIQGNQLIDGDGVWCYQIPMNLDYVVTDEFGNIVPTNNPNKGIATRTSVRFRFSVNETGSEGISRHRAEYLVPNNPMPSNAKDWDKSESGGESRTEVPMISNWSKFDRNYEFGSATPDECFRDLYWNKVYSVKNYVPRLQSTKSLTTDQYTGIRTINYHNNVSPFPFNNVRFRFPFSYIFLCILMEVFFVVVAMINAILSIFRIICIGVPGLKLFGVKLYWYPFDFINCISMTIEDDEAGDGSTITYAPGCWGRPPKGAKIGDMGGYTNRMQRGLAQDAEVVNFDFYNDWINGCLYMPLWFWKKTKKKKYFFGLFSKRAVNKFCNASQTTKNLRLAQGCAVSVNGGDGLAKNVHKSMSLLRLPYGVIYEKTNSAGLKLYYYCSATTTSTNISPKDEKDVPFIRLFATDIILLGSMADCDLDSMPKMFSKLPSTTANIPFMVSTKIATDNDKDTEVSLEMTETTPLSVTGMDWGSKEGKSPKKLVKGLLIDLSCTNVTTYHKSIINTRRLCELGVTLDGAYDQITPKSNGTLQYKEIEPDGMITRIEIGDLESRAMFATLNHNGLDKQVLSPVTNYNTYKLQYLYPIEFDGELKQACQSYTNNHTTDEPSMSYLRFRYGTDGMTRWAYDKSKFPMYNNSFYFYFGINSGKTALEKFYTKFYADCFNNVKKPFSMSVIGTPGSWCNQDAHADITLSKIRSPYTVEVIDGMGNPFIVLENLEYDTIFLDYWDDNDPYKVIDRPSNSVLLAEATKYGFTTEEVEENIELGFIYKEKPKQDNTGYYYQVLSRDLTNGLYTVKVTDAYNRVISSELNLLQSTLNIEIDTNDLSDQYEVNKFIDIDSSGKIILKSVSIDGAEYRFTNLISYIDEGSYEFTVQNVDNASDSKIITFKIKQKNIYNDNMVLSFNDTVYLDNNKPFVETDTDGNVRLVFKIKTADQFDISSIMYCGIDSNKELSDNIFETTVSINNSEPMVLLFQGLDTDIIKNAQSADDSIITWSRDITNPEAYKFPTYSTSTIDWWNTYVDSLDSNNINSEDNMLKIITYKLNSLLKIANAIFCTGSQNILEFSSTGGSQPTMYMVYPDYPSITSTNSKSVQFGKYNYSNSSTTIQAESNYPTVVNSNYYSSSTETKNGVNKGYQLNNIFNAGNLLGNYVGLVDSNNEKKTKLEGIKPLSNKDNEMLFSEPQDKIDSNMIKGYFKVQTVDKRADYTLHILKDVNTNIVTIDASSMFFGGVAFACDENKNIISETTDTEYFYSKTGIFKCNDFNNIKTKRKYYNIDFRTDRQIKPTAYEGEGVTFNMLDMWVAAENSTYEFPVFKLKENITYRRGDSLSWSQISYSYNTDAAIINDKIECDVSDGNEIDGIIGTDSYFRTPASTMEAIAKDNFYNVYHKKNSTYSVDNVNFQYAIGMDEDASHSVYTNAPIFIASSSVTVEDIRNAYNNKAVKNTTVLIPDDYKDTYQQLKDTSNKTKYIASNTKPNQRLADDDDVRGAVSYRLNVSKGNSGYPVVMREYVDSSFRNTRLARNVFSYEIGPKLNDYDTKDGCFRVSISSSERNSWLNYCSQNASIPIPPGQYFKKQKKRISYVLLNFEGGLCVTNRNSEGITNPVDFIQYDTDRGQYMIAAKVANSDIYTEAYRIGETNQFIIPFYTPGANDSDDGDDEEELDENVTYGNPVWYKKKDVYVYVKGINGLVYRYWKKF